MFKGPINLIGKCGFFCGSCPTYLAGKCKSCRAEHKKGDCYTFDCVDAQNVDYCGLCPSFPAFDSKRLWLGRGHLKKGLLHSIASTGYGNFTIRIK